MYLKIFMIITLTISTSVTSALIKDTSQSSYDPGACNNTNHGNFKLYKDRQDNEKLLVCSKDNGVFGWQATDGSLTIGEIFNPAYDCSDILNQQNEAKDGYYWVKYNNTKPKKVWCDMTTDGGGFMLIGRKKDARIWSVPSDEKPVKPNGDPHWTSSFGDAPMIDFRVQMATSDDFRTTKAHWSFRFNSKRPLKKLMMKGEKGCDSNTPGIGDIAYVTDLRTGNIVTTTFRCSQFGLAHPLISKLGWSMMNSCLQKPCLWGFGFHHKYPIQLTYSGAFSYSVPGNVSGIVHDATAFVGCAERKCCGCFGPVDGTKNYCSKDCKPLNGGTVTKNIYTWFWIRSTLPKKVWSKCMEYKVKDENGLMVWYKLTGTSVVPSKGRCEKNSVLLNDGIVVVPDADTAKNIPPVPGQIAYHKDNKELYLRGNKTWNVIAQEKKVTDLFDRLEKQLGDINRTLQNYLTYDDLPNSVILNRGQNYLSQLKQWLPVKSPWILCYRATSHGWGTSDFHSRCDNKGPTITIIRVGTYVFGGFTDNSWDGSSGYKSSTKSFIFSLRNKDNLPPFKAPVYRYSQYAIYCSSSYGPTFGAGHDMYIRDNAHSNTGSYTYFGYTYQPPSGYNYTSSNARALLAGSYSSFYVSEIEVFYLR